MLRFDRLHSTDVANDEVIFRVLSTDNQKFEFALTREAAELFTLALQAAATRLSPKSLGRSLVPRSVQPVIGPDMEPGLSIDLGGNMSVELSFPPQQLADLKAAIQQLEAHSKPDQTTH